MRRSSLVRTLLSLGLLLVTSAVSAAPSSLGQLSVTPRIVPIGKTSVVTATISITDSTYLAGSAYLFRADSTGKVIARIAQFFDNGTSGDRIAGDGIFTARYAVSSAAPLQIPVVANAAFSGTLLRVTSTPEVISVNEGADVTSPKGTFEGGQAVFRDNSGNVVLTVPVAENVETEADGVIERVSEVAAFSADQTHLAVIKDRGSVSAFSEEVSEFGLEESTFKLYSASSGLLFERSAEGGKYFYGENFPDLVSSDGGRVLAITLEEPDLNPTFSVYSRLGELLHQSSKEQAHLLGAAISADGSRFAYMMVQGEGALAKGVFRVVSVGSGDIVSSEFSPQSSSYYFVPAGSRFTLFVDGVAVASLP